MSSTTYKELALYDYSGSHKKWHDYEEPADPLRREVITLDRLLGTLMDTSTVRVMSFSWLAVRRVQRLLPGIPTVYLMDQVPWPYRDGSLPKGVTIAGPGIDRLRKDPDYIARLKSHGHRVHVWTVDAPEDVQFCLDHGVDAIISNRPRAVLELLGR